MLMPELKKSRDRITKLIGDRNQFKDINTAIGAALSGQTTYGQAMNAIKAGQIQEEQNLNQIIERQQKAERERQAQEFEKQKYLSGRRDKFTENYTKQLEKFYPDPEAQRAVHEIVTSHPDFQQYDETTPYSRIPDILTQAGRVAQTLDPSFTGKVAEAPKTRTINRGGTEITQQFNPQTKKYEDISEAPRWQTKAEAVNVLLPEGGFAPGREKQDGSLEIQTGKGWEPAPPGSRMVGLSIQGGKASDLMESGTKKNVEGNLLASQEGLQRLEGIRQSFKPEFQQLSTRWGAMVKATQEKAEGVPFLEAMANALPGGVDQQTLSEYATFRRRSLDNINRYIKDITGAQMSEPEANRLRQAMPDPGEGLIPEDSPTEFMANLADVYRDLRKAQARSAYALKKNLDWRDIPLDRMEQIMRERLNEIKRIMPDQDVMLIKQQLAKEFGLPLMSAL